MKFCDEKIQNHLLNGGKIKRKSSNLLLFLDSNGKICYQASIFLPYSINKNDLTADDWEIVPKEWNWDKIIKDKILCQFWNENKSNMLPIVGYLIEKTDKKFIRNCNGGSWKNCEPIDIEHFNIIKDRKDYEK